MDREPPGTLSNMAAAWVPPPVRARTQRNGAAWMASINRRMAESMRCLFGKKGAFSRGDDLPGCQRSFGFAKFVEEARPKHQSGQPGQDTQVCSLVAAAYQEVDVSRPAVRRAER